MAPDNNIIDNDATNDNVMDSQSALNTKVLDKGARFVTVKSSMFKQSVIGCVNKALISLAILSSLSFQVGHQIGRIGCNMTAKT